MPSVAKLGMNMAVIITEVAFDDQGRFAVELFNNGTDDVDVSGQEISFQFPAIGSVFGVPFPMGTVIDAGETLVIGHSSIDEVDLSPADSVFDQTGGALASPPLLTLVYLGDNSDISTATDHFGVLSGSTFALNATYEGSPTRAPDPDVMSNNIGDFTVKAGFSNNTLGTPCFLSGTLIATPSGERCVEEIEAGDFVLTEDGRSVRVLWLGHKHIRSRIGIAKEATDLVCFAAGAIGNHSDLYVTADHGMVIEGYLVNAGALVNGETILFVPLKDRKAGCTVFHIETENHDVVLANGAPCETFIDYVTRSSFDNYDAYLKLTGAARMVPEMSLPRISTARLLPDVIRARLGVGVVECRTLNDVA